MAYYGYIRVSTKTQAESGYGLATQTEKITEYANAQGFSLAHIFCDAGVSGTDTNREGFSELLAEISSNDNIIVLNTSRLWRCDTVKVLVTHELRKVGAEIISIEQPNYSLYTTDPNDFLINSILGILDEYDRLLINRKLAAGRRQRAKSGKKPCGAAPYGYKWDNRTITIDPIKASTIDFIFKAYKDTRSYEKVSIWLNKKIILAPRGGKWSRQQVKNIIMNDFYAGVVTHGNIRTIGDHPVIVSPELFLACNPEYKSEILLR